MKAQKCPVCGIGTLKKEVGIETFEYKGMTTSVPNYITFKCDECGEAIVDKTTLKESGRILKDFQRQVDGMLTGEEIKRIRAKLNLTQEEMAEIVGGGLKGFARYETGQVCQSKGMDNLLRILDAYPFALNVIQKNQIKKLSLHREKKVITYDDFKALKRYRAKTKTKKEYSLKMEGAAYGT